MCTKITLTIQDFALAMLGVIGAYSRVHALNQANQMTTETILVVAQALRGPQKV